jgi:DNA-binding transcriptional LysR family regulator
MELNQLRGFLTVAKTGSFTQAARLLFVTQPALSIQIKGLEEELGEPLFERQGKQIYLTAAGQMLRERAEQILGLVEQTNQEIVALQGLRAGRLTIGTNDSICLYLLPELIHFFRDRFPGIELHLTNRHSTEVVSLVIEGMVDFGLVTLPALEPRIEAKPLFWREDVAICSPGHPLTRQHSVTLADIAQYPLLLLDKGSHSRGLLDQLLARAGLMPKVVMELGSVEVIKRFVEIDLGVSIIPGFTAEAEIRSRRLHAIRLHWLPNRAVGIVQRRKGHLSPAAQMFLQLLKNHVPEVWLAPVSDIES